MAAVTANLYWRFHGPGNYSPWPQSEAWSLKGTLQSTSASLMCFLVQRSLWCCSPTTPGQLKLKQTLSCTWSKSSGIMCYLPADCRAYRTSTRIFLQQGMLDSMDGIHRTKKVEQLSPCKSQYAHRRPKRDSLGWFKLCNPLYFQISKVNLLCIPTGKLENFGAMCPHT